MSIPSPTAAGTGVLNIPDSTGHSQLTWTTDDPASIAAAQARFDALVGPSVELRVRRAAFRIAGPGGDGVQITTFDPTAPRIDRVAPLAGG